MTLITKGIAITVTSKSLDNLNYSNHFVTSVQVWEGEEGKEGEGEVGEGEEGRRGRGRKGRGRSNLGATSFPGLPKGPGNEVGGGGGSGGGRLP